MGIKVAINGYGRIGRQVLRAIYDYNLQDQLEVVGREIGRASCRERV